MGHYYDIACPALGVETCIKTRDGTLAIHEALQAILASDRALDALKPGTAIVCQVSGESDHQDYAITITAITGRVSDWDHTRHTDWRIFEAQQAQAANQEGVE